jgi:hypothetical protein
LLDDDLDEEFESPDKYQGLVYGLLQAERSITTPYAPAIALVSPHPKAGVTHITRTLAGKMDAYTEGCEASQTTVVLECGRVARSGMPLGQIVADGLEARTLTSLAENGGSVEARLRALSGNWQHDAKYRARAMGVLRELFKFVLMDCPSLKRSSDICAIAPLVDGVIIVVEADKTTRRQIEFLAKTIRMARGRVLGYILNKRTYPIPSRLYEALETGGLT